jgi:diguanylate cyclase (GGDEF)-like protein
LTVTNARRCLIADLRSYPHLGVIAIDIDHFKVINDRYGHLAGDKILTAVGEELRRECRTHDVVGRLGGEEFAVLLPHTSLDVAVSVAERIRHRLRSSVVSVTEAAPISVTASFCVAAFAPEETHEVLLSRADAELYHAKRAGRDRVVAVQECDQKTRHEVGRICAA